SLCVVLGLAILPRLEIGGQSLAAALHGLRKVHGEGFGVEGFFRLGFGVNVSHACNTTASFGARHRAQWSGLDEKLIAMQCVLHCDKLSCFGHIPSVIIAPSRFEPL